jgi:hypothetical protein
MLGAPSHLARRATREWARVPRWSDRPAAPAGQAAGASVGHWGVTALRPSLRRHAPVGFTGTSAARAPCAPPELDEQAPPSRLRSPSPGGHAATPTTACHARAPRYRELDATGALAPALSDPARERPLPANRGECPVTAAADGPTIAGTGSASHPTAASQPRALPSRHRQRLS